MNYPITFGKYLLLERINVGGMAEVFKAKAFGVEGFERVLAIKRILPSMADDDEFINMFVDEARIAVQLSHANIVQIYELGKYENQYYIAMEYVSGKDLRQILDRFRKRKQILPVPAAAYLTSKICEGLDYAHRKNDASGKPLNLIHRDVSPQNILVSYEGAVKITDFGIAKAEDRASKTQAGVLKGKFGYMSPEQVRGLEIDHRSDIFAVGILMYEMLTGKRLFIGESDFSTLEKVRNADVPPPSQHNPAITPELERVMLKALAREREERYQWTSELHDDLQQFLIEDNTIYNAKRLSGLLRGEFTSDIENELAKMEEFMRMAPPTNEKALSAARAMKNAPVAQSRGSASARQVVGEKTMIFESGFSEMANAPTQISDESHDISSSKMSPQRHDDHATGSVVVSKGLRLEPDRSVSKGGGPQVAVRQKAGRDTTMLIAAGTAFLALLIVLLVMVFKPKAEVGTLIVVTTPVDRDLEVLLDGQSLGNRSPIIRDDVRLGPHSLVVRAPGFKEQTFAVNVESAGTAYHVPVNFGRPISESSGELEIASEPPGALVILDGREIGVTPTSVKDLDASKQYTLIFQKEGWLPQTKTQGFQEGKNKERVVVTLKPVDPSKVTSVARLTIETTPPGATVYINGRKSEGESPVQITDLDPKEAVEIKLVKSGYKTVVKSVRFDGKLEKTEPFTLVEGSNEPAKPQQPAVGIQPSREPKPQPQPKPRQPPPERTSTATAERQPPPPRVVKDPDTPAERPQAGSKNVPGGCSGDGAKLSVNVIGEVNCQVQVGSKKLGGAPVFRQSVPIGKCEVRITCPSGKQYNQMVSLGKGDEDKVIVKPGMWK